MTIQLKCDNLLLTINKIIVTYRYHETKSRFIIVNILNTSFIIYREILIFA